MERTVNTKFFTFNQNNSGGYFVQNEKFGVGEYVIVEALNADDAKSRLESIGDNVSGFSSSCGCCGERWSSWVDDSDGTAKPEIYGEPVAEMEKNSFREKAYIHYFDGSFETVKFKEGE